MLIQLKNLPDLLNKRDREDNQPFLPRYTPKRVHSHNIIPEKISGLFLHKDIAIFPMECLRSYSKKQYLQIHLLIHQF